MKLTINNIPGLILLMLLYAGQSVSQTKLTYEVTDSIFINPERGFTAYRSNAVTPQLINSLRAGNVSVIQRIYTIPQYNSIPLPASFLTLVNNDLNAAREGGVKLVLRFSYTNNQNGEDAALDTILLHINQLEPVLQENSDVIVYVEAGFIGAWGEWYYSSHGLNNTAARGAVLNALLDALPQNRNVVVRTPDYKRKILGITEPLDFDDAFSETPQARTGAHNDCFLASLTDYGTYVNVEADKTYLNLDNRFVPQGGETCCDCGYAGCTNALKDLERMHWSLLNKDYHSSVLNRWVTEGCMDEIKRRLGYRFELLEAVISDSIRPGGIYNLDFRIANIGFASPFNPRNLEVIIRNNINGLKYRMISDDDPRLWLSGDTTDVNITAGIPAGIPEGEYSVHLFLADPEPRLHDRHEYAIRIANENVWEDSTGYNSLNHNIMVTSSAEGEDYSGDKFFEPYNPVTVIEEDIDLKPESYRIDAYPNPFNGTITIEFNFSPEEIIDARIFDVLGRSVKEFRFSEYRNNKILWNAAKQGTEISSGFYFISIKTDGEIYTRKFVFLK